MVKGGIWAVLLALAVVLAALVAMRPLLPIDETRYLAIAWEMHLSGDVVHLTKNFALYTDKPPLLFWLINLVWLLTGVQDWAGRAVGPLMAVLVVAGTYGLAGRIWPAAGVGPRAAVILCGFSVFLVYGSATMFDCLLALGVLGGVAALWAIATGANTVRNWALFGLALAFGVYAKGPVILVHLMPLVLTLPWWAPVKAVLGQVAKGVGAALVLALVLVALWLVPALITGTPEYRTATLWTQSAGRVAGGVAHDRPVWFLVALLPVLLFPWGWSWTLWGRLRGAWRTDAGVRLCVIWAASALVLFSLISGKQVHYLIPEFPAVALLFAQVWEGKARSLAWLPVLILAVVFGAFGLGLIPAKGEAAALVPLWPALVFAALCVVLAVLAWRLPLLPGHVLAGVGVVLGLHFVIVTTGLHAEFEGDALAAVVAQHAAAGVAVTNPRYNAEVEFAARLTAPVALPQTVAEVAAWAAAHPGGVVVGEVSDSPLVVKPQGTASYMGHLWGWWPAEAVTAP